MGAGGLDRITWPNAILGSVRGWAKQEGQKGNAEGTNAIFSVLRHHLGGSGHGTRIPILGKSHKHMEERENTTAPEAAFLPSDSDSRLTGEEAEAQEDTAASSRLQS